MKKLFTQCLLVLITLMFAVNTQADMALLDIQQQWAKVNYQMKDDAQVEGFESLISDIEKHLASNPKDVEYIIWKGISLSTLAGAKGGLGALSIAEQAKETFEQAIEINGAALNGSAYTSLGTLYSNVPGWPLGFGSDKKAKKLFIQALEINPDGIDSNYFYADFLYNERKYKDALKYLERAKQAKQRPDRPIADEGRRKEIEILLKKLKKKIRK